MVPPTREIVYFNCDDLITEDVISDIEDDLSGIWCENLDNENHEQEQRHQNKSRKRRRNNQRRHRQGQRRLSLSNCVNDTLNNCNTIISDTPPSIPKQWNDFIVPSTKTITSTIKHTDNDNSDDGTREPSSLSLSASADVSEHNKYSTASSTKTVDLPPFVPRRKKSVSGNFDNSLVATLTSYEFLRCVAMTEIDKNDNKTNDDDFLPLMGHKEVCDMLDCLVDTLELESI